MELSATAKVILGMLAMRPRSGYEIKSFVDDSTRYFWAASYGQIYPELKRLSEHGLVEGTDAPTGGRQRTVYRLTDEGMAALREWHEQPAEIYELRDEGLLKLFLAGAVDPARASEIARERATQAADTAGRLREVEARAKRKDLPAYSVLLSGIAFHDFIAAHFERVAGELERHDAKQTSGAGAPRREE
ncbi:MAG: PadR family transcriptional regulator [Actinomycetota bacterium]|nr:PadR family transcriptional regulator [Actinomycetota bacterium]